VNAERVYEREVETSSALGRVRVELDLCAACGLAYRNPRPTREELREYYETSLAASGSVWRESGRDTTRGRLIAERKRFLERVARERTSSTNPPRLLDVGCAGGHLLEALELPAWRVVGLEPSRSAAARARERGIEVVEGRLESCELPPGSFTLVSCVSVLEHVWDVREFVAALDRLVEPEGLLFVEVPDSCRPIPQVAEFYSFEHLTHFTRGTLERLLAEHGYESVRFERPTAPALRLAARKVGVGRAHPIDTDHDRDALRRAILAYGEERTRFEHDLAARLDGILPRIREGTGRIAIYGAGDHTRFLLDLVDLSDSIVGVLDSDPAKRGGTFLGWPVHAPEDVAELDVDAVVLSSQPFQEEMAARIEPVAVREGIEIVRCYPKREAA